MKKLVSILLVILFCTAALAACNGGGETETSSKQESQASQAASDVSETESSTEASGDKYLDSAGHYTMGGAKSEYEGRTFSILVRGSAAGTYQSDDFTTGSELYGETLDSAVDKRNKLIEQNYGVTLNVLKNDTIDSDIRLDFESGTHLYDAVMPTLSAMAIFAQDGALYNMRDLKNMDLDAPWYDKNATDAYSIGGMVFFTTGDITILNKVNTPSMLFNKDYAEKLKLEDLYQLVKDHKWTYDKMMEIAKSATADTDGEAGMTGADTWGVLASYADALSFYGAAGKSICSKDADDYPYLSINDTQSVEVLKKVLEDMSSKGTWCCYAQDFEPNIWVTSLEAFKQGRVLFRPSAFSATTKLRISGTNFGILPMPLWNEEQDEYYAYCGSGETAGIAIPLGCEDPEFSAYMVEVCSCEAKNYITPAYVEINLKSKDAQDEDSLEMLEIIFNNIKYDIGEVYNFSSIKQTLNSMVQTGDSNIVSKIDSIKDAMDDQIKKVIEDYKARY